MASKIVTADRYRKRGFTVAFFKRQVHLWKRGHPAVSQPIDRGAWMQRLNGWEAEGEETEERLIRIRAHCYCGRGWVGTCDYCLGVRAVAPD